MKAKKNLLIIIFLSFTIHISFAAQIKEEIKSKLLSIVNSVLNDAVFQFEDAKTDLSTDMLKSYLVHPTKQIQVQSKVHIMIGDIEMVC